MAKTTFKRYLLPIIQNDSGIALIISLLTITLLTLMGTAALTLTEIEIKISANDRGAKEAFYIAEAGIEHARALLRTTTFDDVLDGGDDDINKIEDNGILLTDEPLGNGRYDVRVSDNDDIGDNDWDDSDGRVIVTSTGTAYNGTKSKIEIVVSRINPNPTVIQATVTANGPIRTNGIDGIVQIDGRNRVLDLVNTENIIEDSGLLGIRNPGILNQSVGSLIGGTDSGGEDVDPAFPADAAIRDILAEPLTTPEDVFGLTMDDQLKIWAQSGINGSQYVIDPDDLVFDDDNPLTGITYVELPVDGTEDNNKWDARDVNFENSSGILIVHNSESNAVLTNTSTGTFAGVIIADNFQNIDNTIIGAVVTLANNPDSFQIENGAILYSREAIDMALASGLRELTTVSWQEVSLVK